MELVRGALAGVGAGKAWEGQRGVSGARARSRSPSGHGRPPRVAVGRELKKGAWLRPSEEAECDRVGGMQGSEFEFRLRLVILY